MIQLTQTGGTATREPSQDKDRFERLREQVQTLTAQFRQQPLSPASAYHLETQLKLLVQATARDILEEEFNRREPATQPEAAPRVRYRGQTYRINKKTKAEIATSFGVITLWSFLYLNDEA